MKDRPTSLIDEAQPCALGSRHGMFVSVAVTRKGALCPRITKAMVPLARRLQSSGYSHFFKRNLYATDNEFNGSYPTTPSAFPSKGTPASHASFDSAFKHAGPIGLQ